jgi:hypothetical protein
MKSKKMIKFEELAEKRMNTAIKKISLIGNLSHTGNYEYTDAHVAQIMRSLKAAIREVESRFANKGKAKESGFRFRV